MHLTSGRMGVPLNTAAKQACDCKEANFEEKFAYGNNQNVAN